MNNKVTDSVDLLFHDKLFYNKLWDDLISGVRESEIDNIDIKGNQETLLCHETYFTMEDSYGTAYSIFCNLDYHEHPIRKFNSEILTFSQRIFKLDNPDQNKNYLFKAEHKVLFFSNKGIFNLTPSNNLVFIIFYSNNLQFYKFYNSQQKIIKPSHPYNTELFCIFDQYKLNKIQPIETVNLPPLHAIFVYNNCIADNVSRQLVIRDNCCS